jgi:ADP-ribose pyrophosphatase
MYDDDYCLARYNQLRREQPDLVINPAGCPTRIILDPTGIRNAQAEVQAERVAAGIPIDDLRVGVLAEDHYLGMLIRDAVQFADGKPGLYNRVVATGGVAVLPLIDDGIALIRIFRHAARRWFLEAPQGFVLPDADPAEEARRELMEEIGATVVDVVPLGVVYTSTALTSEHLKMFAARVSSIGAPERAEGIESVHVVPRDQIDDLVRDGTICDGPTITLVQQCRIRGLL